MLSGQCHAKMNFMPPRPTAEYAVKETVYATINHNLPIMVYVVGAVFILLLLFLRPNRKLVFFFVGFALLAFNFEYMKHIASGLQEQTRITVESTGYQSVNGRRLMDLVFQYAIPFGSYLGGWGMMFLGIVFSVLPMPKFLDKRRHRDANTPDHDTVA